MRTVGLNVNLTKSERRKLKLKSLMAKIKRLLFIFFKWVINHVLEIAAIIISIIALLKQ